jgi:hypothetical protein
VSDFQNWNQISFCSKLDLELVLNYFFVFLHSVLQAACLIFAFQHALVSSNEMKMQCALVSAIEMKITVGKICLF